MKQYKVENFTYNGFMVGSKPGITNYTVTFKEWTNDPGIAKWECSDGKDRLIPDCCIINLDRAELPHQSMDNMVYFGEPTIS